MIPLFTHRIVKFCLISSEPRSVLWRIINVKYPVSPHNPVIPVSINHHTAWTKTAAGADVRIVKNVPSDRTTAAVGSSHQRIYFTKASASIEIPDSEEYCRSGSRDSKLNKNTGSIHAVSIARNLTMTSLAVPNCLLSISSFILFLLSFIQNTTATNTGYSPRDRVI